MYGRARGETSQMAKTCKIPLSLSLSVYAEYLHGTGAKLVRMLVLITCRPGHKKNVQLGSFDQERLILLSVTNTCNNVGCCASNSVAVRAYTCCTGDAIEVTK